jgi:menaquinone-9 beta-reductase
VVDLDVPVGSVANAMAGNELEVDILVIGGGPAGAAAATTAARCGRSVLLIDKATFPRDKCCGDGLTSGALRRLDALGLDPATIPSWQWVDDVELSSNRRTVRSFPLPKGPGHFAAVAPRTELDAAILDLARVAGVDVRENTTLAAIRPGATNVVAELNHATGTTTVRAGHVVAADGMWSTTRKLLSATGSGESLREPESEKSGDRYLGEWHGYRQYGRSVHTEASRKLWIWFEPDLLPGYLWSFPLANGRVNVGFGILRDEKRPTKEMKALWKSLLDRPHVRAVLGPHLEMEDSPKAWPIPAAIGSVSFFEGRVLFVGDAVRACDVLTGEGIGQALQTGVAAAECIVRESRTGASAAGQRYAEQIESEMGPDHKMSTMLENLIANPWVAEGAIRLSGSSSWTRRNFARWLFEDYARGIALTPTRWRWGLMSGAGAYERLRPGPASAG